MNIKAMVGRLDETSSKRYEMSLDEGEGQSTTPVSDSIRFLWRGRMWVVAAAALGLVLGVVFLVYTAVSKPSITSYRAALALTMKGARPGQYPSGAPFAASDLRSPAVLEEAYRNSNLQSYNFSIGEFSKSITAESYSPNIDIITARFRARAGARNITPEELKTVESAYRQELDAVRNEGILVTFTVDGKFGIPDEVGRKVVNSIPTYWAQEFIDSLGVTAFPVARSEDDLVDAKVVASLDYPLEFDYIEASASQLLNRIKAISEIPNAWNVSVSDPKQTLFDLQRRVNNVRTFQIDKVLRPLVDRGLNREIELTMLAYENRVQVLALDQANDERRSASISSLIRERNAGDNPNGGGQGVSVDGTNSGNGASISTLGDSVVDRIVQLSVSSAGAEFREKLLGQKLEIEDGIADNIKQRQLIERRLAGLRGSNTATDPAKDARLAEVFGVTAAATIAELNAVWKLANEVLSSLNSDRLNEDKTLYNSLPLADSAANSAFYESTFVWAVFGGLIVLFSIGGLIAYLFNSIVKHRAFV